MNPRTFLVHSGVRCARATPIPCCRVSQAAGGIHSLPWRQQSHACTPIPTTVRAVCWYRYATKESSVNPYTCRMTTMITPTRRATDSDDDNTVASRANRLCAELVEVALVMQEMLGTRSAANYLRENHVSIDVAARVLTRPMQRRWRHSVNVLPFATAPLLA